MVRRWRKIRRLINISLVVESHNLHSSAPITELKSVTMSWEGQVERMEQKRSTTSVGAIQYIRLGLRCDGAQTKHSADIVAKRMTKIIPLCSG
jgi:hypothetical protein